MIKEFDLIKGLSSDTVKEVSDNLHSLPQILENHCDVFKDELGTLKGVEAKIYVDPGTQPIFFKPRPLPYAMKAKVERELENLLHEGVIEPVQYSDWAAPVVPVLKPNGQIRLCGDYKVTVNRVSKLEQYPIPTMEDLAMKLTPGSVFHKLDLSHAYSQIKLSEESKEYVTINTHKGLFRYTRLPYGICTGSVPEGDGDTSSRDTLSCNLFG